MDSNDAFFAFEKRRAKKGQFKANNLSETSTALSQCVKLSAVKNHITTNRLLHLKLRVFSILKY